MSDHESNFAFAKDLKLTAGDKLKRHKTVIKPPDSMDLKNLKEVKSNIK